MGLCQNQMGDKILTSEKNSHWVYRHGSYKGPWCTLILTHTWASLKLTTWPSLASSLHLPSCLRLSECWHCRYEPCYLTHFFFLEASVYSHCTPVINQPSQKTLALCVPAGRFFILFLSEHQPSVYDPCLTCYFSNWSGDYQRLLWYIGMLSVGSIYLWDRKLARLPQCSTVFFDLSML